MRFPEHRLIARSIISFSTASSGKTSPPRGSSAAGSLGPATASKSARERTGDGRLEQPALDGRDAQVGAIERRAQVTLAGPAEQGHDAGGQQQLRGRVEPGSASLLSGQVAVHAVAAADAAPIPSRARTGRQAQPARSLEAATSASRARRRPSPPSVIERSVRIRTRNARARRGRRGSSRGLPALPAAGGGDRCRTCLAVPRADTPREPVGVTAPVILLIDPA